MSIIRIESRQRWSSIANATLEDQSLSWKARGLLAFLLTKPPGWQVHIQHLVDASDRDGETAVRSALKELCQYGYATFQRKRDTRGIFNAGDWTIRESPQQQENPHVENPNVDNRNVLVKTEKKLESTEEEERTEEKKKTEKPQTAKALRTDYSPGFLEWWEAYPHDRRQDKPMCFAVWVAHALESRTGELVEKLERLAVTNWATCERKYIKTSLPYLHSGRYEDDLVTTAVPLSARGVRF